MFIICFYCTVEILNIFQKGFLNDAVLTQRIMYIKGVFIIFHTKG